MGCGASQTAKGAEQEKDEEDEPPKETKVERKKRKARLQEYRKAILSKNERCAKEMLEDDNVIVILHLVEEMNLAIFITIDNGEVLFGNSKALAMLGYDSGFSPGTNISKFIRFDEDSIGAEALDFEQLVQDSKDKGDLVATGFDFEGNKVPIEVSVVQFPFQTTAMEETDEFADGYIFFVSELSRNKPSMSSSPCHSTADSAEKRGTQKAFMSSRGDDEVQLSPKSGQDMGRDGRPRLRSKKRRDTDADSNSDCGSDVMSSASSPSSMVKKADKARLWAHGDVTISIDSSGSILAMSHGAQKLFSCSPDDARGKNIDTFVLHDDQGFDRSLGSLIADGEAELLRGEEDRRFTVKSTEEQLENILVAGILETQVGNEMIYTARLQVLADRSLKQRKGVVFAVKGGISDEMAAVFEHSKQCIVVTSLSGEIQYCNELTMDLLRFTVDDVLFEDLSILLPYPYREQHADYIRGAYNRISFSFFGRPRAAVVISKLGKVYPVTITVTELVTPQYRSLYVASFRIVPLESAQESDPLKKLVEVAEADTRNNPENILQEIRARAEARMNRPLSSSRASSLVVRRAPKSPRGSSKNRHNSTQS